MEQFQQKIIQKNVNNMNKNMEQNKERTKYELCPLRTYSIWKRKFQSEINLEMIFSLIHFYGTN